jgi:hypothetical protein
MTSHPNVLGYKQAVAITTLMLEARTDQQNAGQTDYRKALEYALAELDDVGTAQTFLAMGHLLTSTLQMMADLVNDHPDPAPGLERPVTATGILALLALGAATEE